MEISDVSFVFLPSLTSHSEHIEAQLWHMGCLHRSLLFKDMHKPVLRFQVGLSFFVFQISCSNFLVQRTFQVIAQTQFDARIRIISISIATSFPLWYPNIRAYSVTCSSQLKWISGFIFIHSIRLNTVHSIACNKLEVLGSRLYWRNYKCYLTMTQWDSEWLTSCVLFYIGNFRNQNICVSQGTACVAVLTWQSVMWYWLHCL